MIYSRKSAEESNRASASSRKSFAGSDGYDMHILYVSAHIYIYI